MSDLLPVVTSSPQPDPVDSLIAAFAKQGLVSEEIADTIWLALEIQQYQQPSSSGENPARSPDELPPKPIDPLKSSNSATNTNTTTAKSSLDSTKQAEIIPAGEQTSGGRNLAIRLPDARSLPEPLALARALRPLFLRVPSNNLVLDEAATIDRIADEQLWTAVLKPDLEPWLELALVVDESPSMLLWQRTIRELQSLLEGYGIFRDVRTWGMVIEPAVRNSKTEQQVRLRPGIGKAAQEQRTRSPRELLDPQGRRLILITTDCVAAHWHNGTMLSTLKIWSQSGSTAIIQMLPEWLWSRTALGRAAPVRFRGLLPGLPSNCLHAKPLSTWDEIDFENGIKVPIVTLEPEIFTTWSQLVAGKGGVWAPGFVFEPELFDDEGLLEDSTDGDLSAQQQVSRFYHSASPMAWKLVSLLAAAPVICLPVVRIIQRERLPKSRQVHVAEVFLGGLIGPCHPLSEITPNTDPDTILYDFGKGVRTALLESSLRSDSVNVFELVSEFFDSRIGRSIPKFVAYLRDLDRIKDGKIQSNAIATITAEILKQLGGEYTRYAEQLEGGNESSIEEGDAIPSAAIEQERPSIDFRYQVGGCLNLNSSTYVKRQCDRELYEHLKAGEYCFIVNSRQMGKSSLRVQVMKQLQQSGIKCVAIDLMGLGSIDVTAEQWYYGIVDRLIDTFELTEIIDLQAFVERFRNSAPAQCLDEFVDTVLLSHITEPIAIFFDEIDYLLSLRFHTDGFFMLIQSFHERRAHDHRYNRLTFAFFGITPPADLIVDKHNSVFNIGRAVEMSGFQRDEAKPLQQGLVGKVGDPQAVLDEVLKWTGGQPFLTQKVLTLVVEGADLSLSPQIMVEQVVTNRIVDNWEVQDRPGHLTTIRDRLLLSDEQMRGRLLGLYQQTVDRGSIEADESYEQLQLRLTGLVVKREGKLQVYNPIYAAVFNREWVDRALADLRSIFFAEAVQVWQIEGQNESFLLQGQALRSAEEWAKGKQLSEEDYRFLHACQEIEQREAERRIQIEQEEQTLTAQPDSEYQSVKKILIMAANPLDTVRASLEREVAEIRNTLQLSANRDRFTVEARFAVRPNDLQQYLFDLNPQIVHFSGHGIGEPLFTVFSETNSQLSGLMFEDENSRSKLVSGQALSNLFNLFSDRVVCVVLNACYSQQQAEEIAKHIPYVVGINRNIGDIAARKFSAGFYRAIWEDRSIEEAFIFGKNAIELDVIPEELTPVLLTRHPSTENLKSALSPEIQEEDLDKIINLLGRIATFDDEPQRFYQDLIRSANLPKSWEIELLHKQQLSASYLIHWAKNRGENPNDKKYHTLGSILSVLLRETGDREEIAIFMVRYQLCDPSSLPQELRSKTNIQEIISQKANNSISNSQSGMSDRERHILERDVLKKQYNELIEKMTRLREVKAIEIDPATTFKLEKETKQTESEIERLHLMLESVERELNSVPEQLFTGDDNLEEPEGLVELNSTFYIERPPAEDRCYQEIERQGALIRIKAPRQMGKSSLVIRVLEHAQQLGYQTVKLNFQSADESSFTDLDKFLRLFCASTRRQLDLPENIDEYWNDDIFGSSHKCTRFFESSILNTISSPIVLVLDDIDRIFQYPAINQEFLGLLRSWYEAARSQPIWRKLRLIVVHSQESYIPLDIHQSPFNIGVTVQLVEFDRSQVEKLVAKHELRLRGAEIDELMAMLGGHPYLLRLALYNLERQHISLRELLQTAPTEEGLFRDHLRRHLNDLINKPELSAAMRQVVATENPVRLPYELTSQLDGMGLIMFQGNDVIPRCNLYRLYFRDRLGVNGVV